MLKRLRNFFKTAIVDPINNRQLELTTNSNLPVETLENGHICLDNSTSTPLGISGVFSGDWQDTRNYNTIIIGVTTDEDSATDGLLIDWSSDGITIDDSDTFSILANTGKVFTFSPARQYIRITYTNGLTAQSLFNIQTMFKKGGFKASSHRISDSIVGDDDAELVKSVLTGSAPSGIFKNVNITEDGYLAISDNSSGLSIAQGDVSGTSFIHKFGNAPDFDTTDGMITVWDGADDTGIDQMNYVYSTTADIDSISSDSAADTQNIEILGLDINYLEVIQTIALNGQNRVALATNLVRVFRKVNVNTVDNVGHVYCYVNGAITAGVPNVTADVRSVIQPGNNQTLMSLYTIPAGKTGYMRDWFASTAGGSKNSSYGVDLVARPNGGVFQLKHRSSVTDFGSSYIQHKYEEPEVFTEKTDIEMRVESIASPAATDITFSAGFDLVLVDN